MVSVTGLAEHGAEPCHRSLRWTNAKAAVVLVAHQQRNQFASRFLRHARSAVRKHVQYVAAAHKRFSAGMKHCGNGTARPSPTIRLAFLAKDDPVTAGRSNYV